jgi:hypothetical protein
MAATITIFPTANQAGQELAEGCRKLAKQVLGGRANVQVRSNADQLQFLKSLAFDDLVILDASVEPEGQHNYHLVRGIERNIDHVLIVSRTYLPINVRGMRVDGAPIYPHSQSNDAILVWLRQQLTDKVNPLQLPRPLVDKLSFGVRSFVKSSRKDQAARKARHQIFLSYRGRYYEDVERAKARIERGEFHGTPKKVLLYKPEELALADEVLSPLLRWNVLSIISDVVLDCEEFWIIETDDYLRSWWTRGELATFAYSGQRAKLRVYNLERGNLTDAGPEYRVNLTEEQKNRMTRFFTNSHPDMMAPESTEAMRHMAAAGLNEVFPLSGDEVFTERFWQFPLLQCANCSDISPGSSNGSTNSSKKFDVDQFLKNEYPILYPISPASLQQAEKGNKTIRCPNPGCDAEYQLKPTPPRYLWYPLPVGPNKSSLEISPTYRVIKL